MESLITASVGIIEHKKKYYLQIISADQYNFYLVPLSIGAAVGLSELEHLEITKYDNLPKSTLLTNP